MSAPLIDAEEGKHKGAVAPDEDVDEAPGTPMQGKSTSKGGGHGPSVQYAMGFHDLVLSVPTKAGVKQVLKGVSGCVFPGELLAVMGPSGAGKTSLLDVLANRWQQVMRKAKLEGHVSFNGSQLTSQQRVKIVSYVAQEDTLLACFTVRETLRYAIRFHVGFEIADDVVEKRIAKLIEVSGLSTCADGPRVGGFGSKNGLSGGQKKRLSIANELVRTESPIILLDEPTTSLDSSAAMQIMEEMRELSHLGHTVVATIHQPSSDIWDLFDRLLLLGEGKVAYFGKASGAMAHFEDIGYKCPMTFSPADFVTDLVTTDFDARIWVKNGEAPPPRPENIAVLVDAFKNSELQQEMDDRLVRLARFAEPRRGSKDSHASKSSKLDLDKIQGASSLVRTYFVTKRSFVDMARNPSKIITRFLMYNFLCLVIGIAYLDAGAKYDDASIQARSAVVFFSPAFTAFMAVAAIPNLIEEKATFLREKRNGAYGIVSIFAAMTLVAFVGSGILAASCSLFLVFMVKLSDFGFFFINMWCVLFFAELIVLCVGAYVSHYVMGIVVCAGIFGIFMAVMGFLLPFGQIPWYIRWLGYVCNFRYNLRGFMLNEFQGAPAFNSTFFRNGDDVLTFFTYNEDTVLNKWADVGIQLAFNAGYMLLFFFLLWRTWK